MALHFVSVYLIILLILFATHFSYFTFLATHENAPCVTFFLYFKQEIKFSLSTIDTKVARTDKSQFTNLVNWQWILLEKNISTAPTHCETNVMAKNFTSNHDNAQKCFDSSRIQTTLLIFVLFRKNFNVYYWFSLFCSQWSLSFFSFFFSFPFLSYSTAAPRILNIFYFVILFSFTLWSV